MSDVSSHSTSSSGFRAAPGHFALKFQNGWSISVAFYNELLYCDHVHSQDAFLECKNAEIMILNPRGDLHVFDDKDTIQGYVSPEQLVKFMNDIISKETVSRVIDNNEQTISQETLNHEDEVKMFTEAFRDPCNQEDEDDLVSSDEEDTQDEAGACVVQ